MRGSWDRPEGDVHQQSADLTKLGKFNISSLREAFLSVHHLFSHSAPSSQGGQNGSVLARRPHRLRVGSCRDPSVQEEAKY